MEDSPVPDPVPPPRRREAILPFLAEIAGSGAVVFAALGATYATVSATESTTLGALAGAAVAGPPLLWAIRRNRRALFYGVRAFAVTIPVVWVVLWLAIMAWQKRPVRTPPAAGATPMFLVRNRGCYTIERPSPPEDPDRRAPSSPR